ncbi:MAG TPA: ATP-grasp domain-containing protein, partial [Gemmatimonadaceae bacterium]|nr:ATP-grasp domain-containing protein [Gemmatimonadaceae bacterium]
STLVALDTDRARVEREAMLAAPPSDTLALAIDKCRTMELAERVGVPAPRTVHGDSLVELLDRVAGLRFPVAVKPRGNSLHAATVHALDFKVQYARTLDELRDVLLTLRAGTGYPLVQEYVRGVGMCVDAVCRDGVPIAMVAYLKCREFPLSGGVSVVRQCVPLDECVERYTAALLGAIGWHGAAMVEFKYDVREHRYTLMEINGRFSAAAAISFDAGVNLPYLATCVHLGRDIPAERPSYEVGTRARWLRGDVLALREHLANRRAARTCGPLHKPPSTWDVVRAFVRDFRPGMCYDEFKRWDWKPGVVEAISLAGLLIHWVTSALVAPGRALLRPVKRRLVRRLA